MTNDISTLAEALGVAFRNVRLLEEALTHRSYLNEHPEDGAQSNERLEFLGDAVLDLVITEHLFKTFPLYQEGQMTSIYSELVNASVLAKSAHSLNLSQYLRMSKGESRGNGKSRDVLLADAMEAVLGAVYLDQGYKSAQNVVMRYIISPNLSKIMKSARVMGGHLYFDAKSSLQTMMQERMKVTPAYRTLEESGPEHMKMFRSGVFIGENLVGEGTGSSKQESEEAAAHHALVKLWDNADNVI